jgi:hypothetical protein
MKNLEVTALSAHRPVSYILRPGTEYLLAVVRILSPIRHTHQPRGINFSPANVLIFKLSSVNRYPACSVAFDDVTALDHELIDNTMKPGQFVRQIRLGSRAKDAKTEEYFISTGSNRTGRMGEMDSYLLLTCLWSMVAEELNYDSASWFCTDTDV